MPENVPVGMVSERVLAELADVLIDRLDQLLDRLTDRALASPTPGSPMWEFEWVSGIRRPAELAQWNAPVSEQNWGDVRVQDWAWRPPLPLLL